MATYAIGDIQGCYQELKALLQKIHYNPNTDQLWFAGDLVNRGPNSLDVLRCVADLPNTIVILGNHDFHLLTLLLASSPPAETCRHTMQDIVNAPDRDALVDWLRQQQLLHVDDSLQHAIAHAGIPPHWTIAAAKTHATEVEQLLRSENITAFLDHLFGDEPSFWTESLRGWERTRYIVNAFTRMRFITPEGHLAFGYKGKVGGQPTGHVPWFQFANVALDTMPILFGHWAALEGQSHTPNAIALDTGCVWGGQLSAYRIEDQRFFSVTKL